MEDEKERSFSMASFASKTISRASLNFGSPKSTKTKGSPAQTHGSVAHLSKLGFFQAPGASAPNPARIKYIDFFNYSNTSEETPYLNGSFSIKVLKQKSEPANGQKKVSANLRKTLVRWKKHKASIQLVGGRISIDIANKKGSAVPHINWTFQVGQVANLGYKRQGAKDFSITFLNDPSRRVINIITDSPETATRWIIGIFGEVKIQAKTFNLIGKEIINRYPTWVKLLNSTQNTDAVATSDEVTLTPEEEKGLIFSEEDEAILERCLREQIDLYVVARGFDHPDTCEAYEKLAIFLRRQFRTGEGDYWLERSEKARVRNAQLMKSEINPNASPLAYSGVDKSALEDLRNPGGMNVNLDAFMEQKVQMASVKMDARIKIVKEAMLNEYHTGSAVPMVDEDGQMTHQDSDKSRAKKDAFDDLL